MRSLSEHSEDKAVATAATIDAVLWEAVEAEELAQRLGLDVGETVRNTPGMKKVHEIIQEVIRKCGTECGSDKAQKPKFSFAR